MTKSEASKLLNIPLSTLNDWEKEDHTKHTLFQFIISSCKKEVIEKLDKQKYHRLFHILNRNSNTKYTYDDIRNAFLKDNYNNATEKERVIYSKFFKECDIEDFDSLLISFNLSKRTIKKLYITLPERKLLGVSKIWDRRFRLSSLVKNKNTTIDKIPNALANILAKKKRIQSV